VEQEQLEVLHLQQDLIKHLPVVEVEVEVEFLSAP
jgi:hypothetical protein